ncbi:unnamed protein product [Brassica oleracea var. botrytis]|uniref:Uncharacterized protein n=2 Tax=Brassica TaxID=3705 RepID=A0A3P6EJE4_BRAOL|nr:hypothetical protein HID58_066717 [Brassica napus]CAF1929628.1 unnamed protein product [Brassica napus]CDY71557.1 BnaCnng73410D [Brassica napus]VDD44617.1 unnamed protein product [Brassica oleracea]
MTGNCPHFDTGQREDGNDDPWGSGGWELYVAETREPENDLKNKGSGLVFNISYPLNLENGPQKKTNGSIILQAMQM